MCLWILKVVVRQPAYPDFVRVNTKLLPVVSRPPYFKLPSSKNPWWGYIEGSQQHHLYVILSPYWIKVTLNRSVDFKITLILKHAIEGLEIPVFTIFLRVILIGIPSSIRWPTSPNHIFSFSTVLPSILQDDMISRLSTRAPNKFEAAIDLYHNKIINHRLYMLSRVFNLTVCYPTGRKDKQLSR